ncbi:DUF2840 domain-containing protein [Acetobacter oeni]|uniref:Glycosidase n=1 Tax=Acetobacter oeni TaxID=304077 RepID=A0A511XP96_9PROT|nr:DUF2840 domain-containing protein [Acetobacter oeni]MBB3884185.1 hypothetical protein [Acetobacter oeni]NHO20275.1 DUF2840 domain-containing protein [Acetobacter oeni]GBR03674.1 hypothetical protein AA21952_1129 [Acetobacter oeni LMG 21952]GEN64792.1 hypothetical protein AOE01nite_30160 [Acetobacter oeni]
MTAPRAQLELTWIEKRVEQWLRFGHPVEDRILDRRRRLMSFTPGSVFGFVRWMANDYGTVVSCVDVVRVVGPDEPCQTIPFVRPGAESLLHIGGWPKVKRVLETIDAVEAMTLDPAAISLDYWRQVGARISAGQPISPYTRERHLAWLMRRKLVP